MEEKEKELFPSPYGEKVIKSWYVRRIANDHSCVSVPLMGEKECRDNKKTVIPAMVTSIHVGILNDRQVGNLSIPHCFLVKPCR